MNKEQHKKRGMKHQISYSSLLIFLLLPLAFLSCKKESWKPGKPLAKEKIRIGVVHTTDPFSENSGYSYAHQIGIEEMKNNLGLEDSQILYKIHVDEADLYTLRVSHLFTVSVTATRCLSLPTKIKFHKLVFLQIGKAYFLAFRSLGEYR